MAKSTEYCRRIEETFEVNCSRAGINHFGCPSAEIRTEEDEKKVYCRELRAEDCPIYSNIEQIIETVNRREAAFTF
jgi:hypothetical protein